MANECNNMVWFYSRDKKLLQSFFNKFRACHDDCMLHISISCF